MRCKLPTDDDATIDETIASYRARGLAFRWLVSPASRPRDLCDRLEARGLVRQYELLGLAAAPALLERRAAQASRDVHVELVRPETVDEWVDASAAGYGLPPADHAALRLDVARLVEQRSSPIVYVLARVGGEAAGSGAVRTCRDGAYFIASSVVPRFRNRGVYTALVGFRAALARQAAKAHVFTLAIASTSGPICLRLGFKEACRMTSYQGGADPFQSALPASA
jgi:GNAT superfamily N-acetyltransferase